MLQVLFSSLILIITSNAIAVGAVAADGTNSAISANYQTDEEAKAAALKICGTNRCSIPIETFSDSCAAVAVSSKGMGFSSGKRDEKSAEEHAVDACIKFGYGPNCKAVKSLCDRLKKATNNGREVQVQNNTGQEEYSIRKSLDTSMSKFCRGKPQFTKFIAEEFGRKFEVSPNSITLDSVEKTNESMWFVSMSAPESNSQAERDMYQSGCNGTFYTPRGPIVCNLHFNDRGIVTNICDVTNLGGIGDSNAYTRNLAQNLKSLYWKRAPTEPAPKRRPGATCYSMGDGRVIPCKD